jgi:hypothetical protein
MYKNNIPIEELERQYKEIGDMIAQRKQEILAREKESRRLEIVDKQDELRKLIAAFIEDYGYYHYETSIDSNDDEFSYLWHMFF